MKRTDYIVILAPMVTELGLTGNALLVFAMIHGFTKDGNHQYVGSFEYIAEWLGISLRSAKMIIKNLISDGYINRTQNLTDRRRPINVYTTNYEALLARVAAGEVIKPTSVKAGSASDKVNGAKNAPLKKEGVNGAKGGNLMVQKFPFNSANFAPNNNYIDIYINRNYSSYTPESSQEEEKLFKIIFLFRNAADPAAEVGKFISWNEARGWQTRDGAKYDTVAKRTALAEYGWDCKTGQRLPAGDVTDRYYKFLKEVISFALEHGGIDPELLLSTSNRYRMSGTGSFVWLCLSEVKKWFKEQPRDQMLGIINKTIALPFAFE